MDKIKGDGYPIEWYDGDMVRKEFNRESDFSNDGILKNSFELIINKINTTKVKPDFIIISLITTYNEVRKYAKEIFGKEYFEVYVKCDKNTLIERDTNGLFK